MDARMLVVSADRGLSELLRPQVENQGCECRIADCYDEASFHPEWADALLLDLELPDGGIETLHRLQIEAPDVRVVAIATNDTDAEAAREAGVERVLSEPFSIADVVDAVRSVGVNCGAEVIDLREARADLASVRTGATDDRPWWATR